GVIDEATLLVRFISRDFPFIPLEKISLHLKDGGFRHFDKEMDINNLINSHTSYYINECEIKKVIDESRDIKFKIVAGGTEHHITSKFLHDKIVDLLQKELQNRELFLPGKPLGRPDHSAYNLSVCERITEHSILFNHYAPPGVSQNNRNYFAGLLMALFGFKTYSEYKTKFTSFKDYRTYLISEVKGQIRKGQKYFAHPDSDKYFLPICNKYPDMKPEQTVKELWGISL
ncbi:MAG: hypothetical protein ACOCXH_13685, partial [Cyclobacteriaceae bacterium]